MMDVVLLVVGGAKGTCKLGSRGQDFGFCRQKTAESLVGVAGEPDWEVVVYKGHGVWEWEMRVIYWGHFIIEWTCPFWITRLYMQTMHIKLVHLMYCLYIYIHVHILLYGPLNVQFVFTVCISYQFLPQLDGFILELFYLQKFACSLHLIVFNVFSCGKAISELTNNHLSDL